MKKILFLFLICICIYSSTNAQQLKTYSGSFIADDDITCCKIEGTTNYSYYESDTGRVYNGSFSFKSNPTPLGLSENVIINGNYINNKKVGKWTIKGTTRLRPYYMFDYIEIFTTENNILDFKFEIKGPFDKNTSIIKSHNQIKCSFKNFKLQGGYEFKYSEVDKNYICVILGTFDKGFFTGNMKEKYYENNIEYSINREYYYGVVIKDLSMNTATGEIINNLIDCNCILDTLLIKKIVEKYDNEVLKFNLSREITNAEIENKIYNISLNDLFPHKITKYNYGGNNFLPIIPKYSNIRDDYKFNEPNSIGITLNNNLTKEKEDNINNTFANLIKEGDEYFNERSYNNALNKFKEANMIKNSQELTEKISYTQKSIDVEKQIKPLIEKGNAFFSQKKYEEALKQYDSAYFIKPEIYLKKHIDKVKTIMQFEIHILKGNNFFSEKNYNQALTEYNYAKDVINTNEIIDLIKLTNNEIIRIRNLHKTRIDLYKRINQEHEKLSKSSFSFTSLLVDYKKSYGKNYEKCITLLNNNCLTYFTIVAEIFKSNNTTGFEINETWNDLDQKAFENLNELDEELKSYKKFVTIIMKAYLSKDKQQLKLLNSSENPKEIINKINQLPYDETDKLF
ncbi:MAG: hypothetical protein WCP69_12765 [Bacteroidota bacterium]